MNWHLYFTYDPYTGLLHWKSRARDKFQTERAFSAWTNRLVGRPVTSLNGDGYVQVRITVQGKQTAFRAARIIWEMHHGPIPKGMEIDHMDRNRSNDVLRNLSLVTPIQNSLNKGLPRNNTSGVKGVRFKQDYPNDPLPWDAYIGIGGKQISLGSYSCLELAVEARKKGEEMYHAPISHINKKP